MLRNEADSRLPTSLLIAPGLLLGAAYGMVIAARLPLPPLASLASGVAAALSLGFFTLLHGLLSRRLRKDHLKPRDELAYLLTSVTAILCALGGALASCSTFILDSLTLLPEPYASRWPYYLPIGLLLAATAVLVLPRLIRALPIPAPRLAILFVGLGLILLPSSPLIAAAREHILHPPPGPLNVTPVPPVVFLAVDGFGAGDLERVDSTAAPHLHRLINGGARGSIKAAGHPMSSVMWAEMMTAVKQDEMTLGIIQVEVPLPGAKPVSIESLGADPLLAPFFMGEILLWMTRCVGVIFPTNESWVGDPLWCRATRAGQRSIVVQLRGSYPARPIDGAMVTDRFQRTINESAFVYDPNLPRVTWPDTLADALRPLPLSPSLPPPADLLTWASFSGAEIEELHSSEPALRRIKSLAQLKYAYLEDSTCLTIAHRLLDAEGTFPSLLVMYLVGPDQIGHSFEIFRHPELMPDLDPVEVQRYDRLLENYIAWLDRQIGRLLERVPAEATVIVIGDHGMHPVLGNPLFTGDHGELGMLIVRSRSIAPGTELGELTSLEMGRLLSRLAGLEHQQPQ